MGNHLWRVCHDSVKEIKLVDSDGRLSFLQARHVSANEIMQRYPQNIVSHADSFYIGQKIPVLSAEAKLEAGQSYFLLPKETRGTVLSAALLASLVAGLSKAARFTSAKQFQIEKSQDGRLRLKILPEFIHRVLKDGKSTQFDEDGDSSSSSSSSSGLCSTPELQKDYQLLVKGRAQAWRPKLETIVEKEKRCKPFRLKRKCLA